MTRTGQEQISHARPGAAHTCTPLHLRRLVVRLAVAVCACLAFYHSASGQNIQFTQGSVGSGLDNTISIPIVAYPGRGAASLPVTLYYSSKVWRVGHYYTFKNTAFTQHQSVAEAVFAEHSASGWTTSLDLPKIVWPEQNDQYNYNGEGTCDVCGNGGGWRVARLYVHMPDGSAHELRQSDVPHNIGSVVKTGVFYAVDGSRMRYDSTGPTTGTLYMPDGSRYELGTPVSKFIDRNGNALAYNAGTRKWTDTLGQDQNLRGLVQMPWPASPQAGTYDYAPPGVQAAHPYKFVWKNLSDALLDTADHRSFTVAGLYLPNPAGAASGPGGQNPNFPTAHSGSPPSLFQSGYAGEEEVEMETLVVGRLQAPGQVFNPVVLSEVILPTGLKYKFYYNEYGEIAQVVYPTGGFDRYTFGQVGAVGKLLPPYTQGSRGVKVREQSAAGDGVITSKWAYEGGGPSTEVTMPDKTRVVTYKHNINNWHWDQSMGREWDYWPFGFEDSRNGMVIGTETYAPNPDGTKGPMIRRTLSEWALTSVTLDPRGSIPNQRESQATRNARPVKEVSLILDTGGAALAKTVTHRYCPLDVSGNQDCPDAEMTTGLDLLEMRETHFAEVDANTAKTGAIGVMPAGATASSSTTEYLNNPDYVVRHILGLVTSVTLKDAAGNPVSKTETSYDELAYSILPSYGDLGDDPAYVDPGTALRGNPTTVRRYVGLAAGTYLETHAQFDQYGNPVNFWDERGIKSQKSYSSEYRHAFLTQTTSAAPDPSGQHGSNQPFTSSITYHPITGQTHTTTDANDQVTEFKYLDREGNQDKLNRLRTVISPHWGWTKTDFNDKPGNLYVHVETSLDADRRTHGYQFVDGLGRGSRSLALESGLTYVVSVTGYDNMGRASETSSPFRTTIPGTGDQSLSGHWTTPAPAYVTTTLYDALGRVRTVTLPDLSTVQTDYVGVYTTVTDQAGNKRRQKTDALGHVVRVDEPDAYGDLGSHGSPMQPSFYEYDTLGNVIRINQGLAQPGSNPANSASYVQRRYFKYDALSRLTHERQVEQAGAILTAADPLTINAAWSRRLTYDETVGGVSYKGLLTTAEDARHVVTNFYYDQLGRTQRVNYSDGTPTVISKYDQARTDAPPAGDSQVTFYNKGRLTEITTVEAAPIPQTQQLYDYDLMGRTRRQRQVVGANTYELRYGYNLAGGLVSEKYPSGRVVNYGYDDAGRLSSAGSGTTAYASGMTYEPFGGLKSMTLGNGAAYSMSYDAQSTQLSSITLTQGAATLQKYEYKYGAVDMATGAVDASRNNGQIAGIESTVGAQRLWQQRFQYDTLGRLASAGEHYGGALENRSYLLSYDYDLYGNRYQKAARNQNNQVAQAWVEDGAYNTTTNRLASGLTYDEAGNVVVDARFRQRKFWYDANNRQRQSSNLDDSGAVQSVYDGAGQRVATMAAGAVARVMVYDAAGDLVAEYGGSVFTDGTQYVMGDQQGSTRLTMASAPVNGQLVAGRQDYLPFGEEVPGTVGSRAGVAGYGQSTSPRQKYAGMEQDEATGMSHTPWREFDSMSARWTAPDPYGGSMDPSSPQSFNRYTYCNNDPVNKVDPTGLMLSDIGVYQTDNAAVATRLERAQVTVLHRYVDGQTGKAQEAQRHQGYNAGFMGATAANLNAGAGAAAFWPRGTHDAILADAMPGADPEDLFSTQRGSNEVDAIGGLIPITLIPGQAYKHGMVPGGWVDEYGIEEATRRAKKKADEFMEDNIKLAKARLEDSNKAGNSANYRSVTRSMAFQAFGSAMHPVMDQYSPAHRWAVYRLHPDLTYEVVMQISHKWMERRRPTAAEMSVMRNQIQAQLLRVLPVNEWEKVVQFKRQ